MADESKLGDARARLEAALAAGDIGTFVWDVAADRLYGDANFNTLFAIELEPDGAAPLGAFVEGIHPEDRARVMRSVALTLETGCPYRAEYRVIAQGFTRWVSARGKVERDAEGRVVRFPGVLIDITEGKQAAEQREQLATAYARHQRLFEGLASATPDLFYAFDLTGRVLYANRRLLEVWGRSFEEAVGKSMYELDYPKWHADMHMREIAEVIQSKRPVSGEVPYTGGSGIYGVHEYIFSPVIGSDGEVEFIAGTTRDVTGRKKIESDLRRSMEQLDVALAASRTGTFCFDLSSRKFVFFDDNLKHLFGFSKETAVEQLEQLVVRVHQDDVATLLGAFSPPALHSGDVVIELRVADGTAPAAWLDYRAAWRRDAQGTPLYLTGACVDVTERKHAEQQRDQLLTAERVARAEAERAGRLKDEFLSTLSHELRTPLNAILGWSQILRLRSREDEQVANGIAVIERNARAQARLIEDLLDMSRIVEGKLRLNVQPLNLAELIDATIATVQPAADARQVRIDKQLAERAPTVRADGARIQQVLWNLLSNAIKFTPKGGEVRVALLPSPSHVEVSVADSGIGIEPEFLPHVFERFRQADGGTTRSHGGLGLGLSIVRSLVEMHGGQVRAYSAGSGHGATFTIELPIDMVREEVPAARHSPVEAREQTASLEGKPLQGLLVLTVEDDEDSRALISRLLEEAGARVLAAQDAHEAFELLQTHRPDVLLSDIGMPGEDGYSLIKRVRELPAREGGDIPAAALTAFVRSEDRNKALLSGFQAHMAKPVDPAELLAVIAGLAGTLVSVSSR